jgi:ankyrin repeat protein
MSEEQITTKDKIINSLQNGDFDTLETFLDNGYVSINACLLNIIVTKNLNALKYFVENREVLDFKHDGCNLLNLACQFSWLEAIDYLCQYDSLTNDTSQSSELLYNPLSASISYENYIVIDHLIKNHSDFLVKVLPVTESNMVHLAVISENEVILSKLLNHLPEENKDLINMKNGKGWTPLHLAVILNNLKLVKLLIENGAKHNILDNKSKTPLELAIDNDNKDIIEYLKINIDNRYVESISLN